MFKMAAEFKIILYKIKKPSGGETQSKKFENI